MKLPVFDLNGKELENIDLSDDIFGISSKKAVIESVVLWYLAGRRAGTASTKTRAEVRGGGKKPWKQKGTGRARSGSIRSPLWNGGGVTFGPKPRSFKYNLPYKVKQLALKMVISDKIKENKVKIIDSFKITEPKTKIMVKSLKNLGVETKKNLILSEGKDDILLRAASNIKGVTIMDRKDINAYYITVCDNLIISKDAAKGIAEALK